MDATKTTNQIPMKSPKLSRDNYKAIKHFNKDEMQAYLIRVYRRGFEAGVKSVKSEASE
ncbi:MAG: hypothetical protein ACI3VY_01925 [Faecousia sp.]